MGARDNLRVAMWIHGGATLAEVESVSAVGLVENVRFTERARRRFRLLWTWSVVRWSSREQDRFFDLHGPEAFDRRMARVNRLMRAHMG